MDLEQELRDARAEMLFREEQCHAARTLDLVLKHRVTWEQVDAVYDAARDRYLALLAEARIVALAETP